MDDKTSPEPLMDQERLTGLLVRAMNYHDDYVCRIRYTDQYGKTTIRVVSPYRFLGPFVLALCLGREECRSFHMHRISECEVVSAHDVLMPENITQWGNLS